ncbi:hypothetical protein GCM10023237_32670 [Streptomyces coeruleoprunus]
MSVGGSNLGARDLTSHAGWRMGVTSDARIPAHHCPRLPTAGFTPATPTTAWRVADGQAEAGRRQEQRPGQRPARRRAGRVRGVLMGLNGATFARQAVPTPLLCPRAVLSVSCLCAAVCYRLAYANGAYRQQPSWSS